MIAACIKSNQNKIISYKESFIIIYAALFDKFSTDELF